jgi:hypothetical protein
VSTGAGGSSSCEYEPVENRTRIDAVIKRIRTKRIKNIDAS